MNGNEVAGWNVDGKTPKRFLLTGGPNEVVVKVYNQRSYTGGIQLIGGHLPEGWHYSMQLKKADGAEITTLFRWRRSAGRQWTTPWKLFTVAKFQIMVDEQTGQLSMASSDFHVWQH